MNNIMNMKYLTHKIPGFAFAVLLMTGITIFSTTEAQAQRRVYRRAIVVRPYYSPYYRPYYGRYNYGFFNDYGFNNQYSQYVFDNSDNAAQSAYNQGLKTGQEDGRKSKSFSFERSHYYHDAGFGNYAEVYRRNFARGYQIGYRNGAAG